MSAAAYQSRRTQRGRWAAVVVVVVLAEVLLARFAERALLDGPGPDLGVLQLRLAYNSGVAFSLGSTAPVWLVTTLTGAVTLGVAVFAWRTTSGQVSSAGFAAIVAGALGNVLDRTTDGVVTDYLHTGWFPTFNLPDVLITAGVGLLLLAALRDPGAKESSEDVPRDPDRST